MKETTFGDSAAARTLAVMLTELNQPKVSRSVTRFLISQETIARTIAAVPDAGLRALFRQWALNEAKTAFLVGVNGKIESFMKNVAVAKFRQKS